MSIIAASTGPIPKERLRIRLEFGKHGTAEDARGMPAVFSAFKPHIYVPEKAGLDDDGRLKNMAEMNSLLQTGEGLEKLCALSLSGCVMTDFEGFAEEEMRIVGRFRPIRIYLAESGAPMDPMSLFYMLWGASSSMQSASESIRTGDVEQALVAAEAGLREFAGPALVERNAIVVEGMERLLAEAPALFPELAAQSELRVLLRYGTAHAALTEMLLSQGFAVESGEFPALDFKAEILLKLSRDFQSPLSREDRLKLIFNDFFIEARISAGTAPDDSETGMSEAYGRIGRESGFLSMLGAAAAGSSDAASFTHIVNRALNEAAMQPQGDANG